MTSQYPGVEVIKIITRSQFKFLKSDIISLFGHDDVINYSGTIMSWFILTRWVMSLFRYDIMVYF